MAKHKGKKPKKGAQPGQRAAPSSPPYQAVWHPSAASERDASEPPKEQVAMEHVVDKLEATGPQLPFPHSSAVKGKDGKGFRELRPRAGRSRWRPVYRQVTDTVFVIFAVAPEAEIDGNGYKKAVKRASKRYDDFEI